jgi:hypothetical protein
MAKTVYISNLNKHMPIREAKRRLKLLIARYTPVVKIKMRDSMLGRAFVSLKERADILSILDKRFFLGTVIKVEYARSDMLIGVKRIANQSKTLILTGIPKTLSREDVASMFKKGVVAVRMVRVKDLALIDFETVEDATAALAEHSDGSVEHSGSRMKIVPSV